MDLKESSFKIPITQKPHRKKNISNPETEESCATICVLYINTIFQSYIIYGRLVISTEENLFYFFTYQQFRHQFKGNKELKRMFSLFS